MGTWDRLIALGQVQDSEDAGLPLSALKALAEGPKPDLVFLLVPYRGAFALRYDLRRTFGVSVCGYYLAERSRKVRRFVSLESALVVARELGLVQLHVSTGVSPPAREVRLPGDPSQEDSHAKDDLSLDVAN